MDKQEKEREAIMSVLKKCEILDEIDIVCSEIQLKLSEIKLNEINNSNIPVKIFDIGQLKKEIQNIPNERLIVFQVAGTDNSAWNMLGEFCPRIPLGTVSCITLSHPELHTLNQTENNELLDYIENEIKQCKEYLEKSNDVGKTHRADDPHETISFTRGQLATLCTILSKLNKETK